jgi:hypothetical protein
MIGETARMGAVDDARVAGIHHAHAAAEALIFRSPPSAVGARIFNRARLIELRLMVPAEEPDATCVSGPCRKSFAAQCGISEGAMRVTLVSLSVLGSPSCA